MGDFNRNFGYRDRSPPLAAPSRRYSSPRRDNSRRYDSSLQRNNSPIAAPHRRGDERRRSEGSPRPHYQRGPPRYEGPPQQANWRYHQEDYNHQRGSGQNWRQTDQFDRGYNRQPFRVGPSEPSKADCFDRERGYHPEYYRHQGPPFRQRSSLDREHHDYHDRGHLSRPHSAEYSYCQQRPPTALINTEKIGTKRGHRATSKNKSPAKSQASEKMSTAPQPQRKRTLSRWGRTPEAGTNTGMDSKGTSTQVCDSDEDTEQIFSSACKYLNLERGTKLVIEASSSPDVDDQVPTAPSQLTRRLLRSVGCQSKSWEAPMKTPSATTLVILNPVLNEAPEFPTCTLAQEFIKNPEKRWLHDRNPELLVGMPYYEKYFIWARMMLLMDEDRKELERAGILRGVFGSLFYVQKSWPLIQAFIDFWNVDGHTVVTSQGESGYSLLLVDDAMGIPLSGHAYDEFIPLPWCAHDKAVDTLQAIFAKICKRHLSDGCNDKRGLVKTKEWLDYFLTDKQQHTETDETLLPINHYAEPEDPFFQTFQFRVSEDKGPAAYFSGLRVDYKAQHSRLVYRAAFIATWLCLYCVPVDAGIYIRPEVFTAAVSIAKGIRKAIGVASLAFLYSSLDSFYYSVVKGASSASDHKLVLPTHFIMGWYAAYWKAMPPTPTCSDKFMTNPPFITDCGISSVPEVNFADAHRIFLDIDEKTQSLLSLDFLGRQGPLHFSKQGPVHLDDSQGTHDRERSLKTHDIDIIISSLIGGVCHPRCQLQNNQVYCPQRFARAHNCDQEAPDFLMDGRLQFSDHLKYTIEGTMQLLTSRLLSHSRTGRYHFELLPCTRRPQCTYEYMKWYTSALSFLQKSDIICATIPSPRAATKRKSTLFAAPATTSAQLSTLSKTMPPSKKAKSTATTKNRAAPNINQGVSSQEPASQAGKDADRATLQDKEAANQDYENMDGTQVENPVDNTLETGMIADNEAMGERHATPKDASPDCVTDANQEAFKQIDKNACSAKDGENAGAGRSTNEEGTTPPDSGGEQREHNVDIAETIPYKLKKAKDANEWNSAQNIVLLGTIKQNIEEKVQAYLEEAPNIFDSSIPPAASEGLDKTPGAALELPKSACPLTKFAFTNILTGLKNLQLLANATNFDQNTFLKEVTDTLKAWDQFFSAHFTHEVKLMVKKVKALQQRLESSQQSRLSSDEVSAKIEQVGTMLEKAALISEQITESCLDIEQMRLAGKKHQEELDSREAGYLEHIQELEADLAKVRQSLQTLRSSKEEHDDFIREEHIVSEAINTSSANLDLVIAKGEVLRKELHQRLQFAEDENGLPAPVQALRFFVAHYPVKE